MMDLVIVSCNGNMYSIPVDEIQICKNRGGESSMISRNIFLTDIDEVMEFVNQVEQCSYDVDIAVDDSVINAKSVLGMLSKGFRRMMRMNIHADHADELLEKIGRFCV